MKTARQILAYVAGKTFTPALVAYFESVKKDIFSGRLLSVYSLANKRCRLSRFRSVVFCPQFFQRQLNVSHKHHVTVMQLQFAATCTLFLHSYGAVDLV